MNISPQKFEKCQNSGFLNKMLKFQFLTKNIFLIKKSLRICNRFKGIP